MLQERVRATVIDQFGRRERILVFDQRAYVNRKLMTGMPSGYQVLIECLDAWGRLIADRVVHGGT